jgi:hypothetical protein
MPAIATTSVMQLPTMTNLRTPPFFYDYLQRQMNNSIITEAFKDQVKALLVDQFPWVSVAIGNLGVTNSLIIKISLDHRQTWANGILENSRWGVFDVRQEGVKLKLSTVLASGCGKVRKCVVKSASDVAKKILMAKSNVK